MGPGSVRRISFRMRRSPNRNDVLLCSVLDRRTGERLARAQRPVKLGEGAGAPAHELSGACRGRCGCRQWRRAAAGPRPSRAARAARRVARRSHAQSPGRATLAGGRRPPARRETPRASRRSPSLASNVTSTSSTKTGSAPPRRRTWSRMRDLAQRARLAGEPAPRGQVHRQVVALEDLVRRRVERRRPTPTPSSSGGKTWHRAAWALSAARAGPSPAALRASRSRNQ